jgi:hypothetical protein
MIQKKCENCGGFFIYPYKKIQYRSDLEGWLCDSCYTSLLARMREFIKDNKEKKVVNKKEV